MKQVFLHKGKAVVKQVPVPLLSNGVVLVQVHYSFISTGTEGAALAASSKSLLSKLLTNSAESINKVALAIKENGIGGTLALISSKTHQVMEIGYSCSGRVVAVGSDVTSVAVGDFVACAGAGLANHAEFVAVPKNLVVKISDPAAVKSASVTTIGAIALQGIRRANLKLGEKVCVVGLGLLGQLTVQLAKQSGCTVIGIDIDPERLELAKRHGADHVINGAENNAASDSAFLTEHYGVDATIITAASSSGALINQAMEMTRRKGKVVIVGDVKLDFARDLFYTKEIDLLISCSYGPGRYDNQYERQGVDYPYAYVRWTENRNMQLIVELIEQKKLSIESLVSQEFVLDDVDQAFECIAKKKALGVLVKYYDEKKVHPMTKDRIVLAQLDRTLYHSGSPVKPYVVPQRPLNVAVIGAGGFTKVKLLPILQQTPGVKIHSIIEIQPSVAVSVAAHYHAGFYGNDYHSVIDNPEIDAVVIATPHALHARQALDCLIAGKAVFVEKPAAVTFDELVALEQFVAENPQSLYCVDFNRSHAPYVKKIQESLRNRSTPVMLQYRMNAGYIPQDHWIQAEAHGGRVIGEACHIFELFSALVEHDLVSISVDTFGKERTDLQPTDNVSVQLRFSDGSCASFIYTAVGNTSLSKERLELFFDGKSIVMDDYKELTGYGLGRSFNATTRHPDKGHYPLLTAFLERAKGTITELPVDINRQLHATRVSLIVDQLARSGGGFVDMHDSDVIVEIERSGSVVQAV